jgi:CRP-like cAMP-binding protein
VLSRPNPWRHSLRACAHPDARFGSADRTCHPHCTLDIRARAHETAQLNDALEGLDLDLGYLETRLIRTLDVTDMVGRTNVRPRVRVLAVAGPLARARDTVRLEAVCAVPRRGRTIDLYCVVPAVVETVRHSMPAFHDPQQNHLLAGLSPAERDRLYPHLRLVPMPLGKVLYESGDVLRHVYFPTNSIVSLLYVLSDGASAEISVVGNEGLIGIALFMGGETTPSRAIVQSAGHAYRLIGQQLKGEFHRNGEMQLLLLRYTQALITQMAQTAVCNRHHSVDQQLCRWLLLSLDRLSSNQLTMTQELIANMLGVRREGVTEAAGKLHKLGIIRYARGHITVLDRPKLEQLCCECYAVVKKETDRLLPRAYPSQPRGPQTDPVPGA